MNKTMLLSLAMSVIALAEQAPPKNVTVERSRVVTREDQTPLKITMGLSATTLQIRYVELNERGADVGVNVRLIITPVANCDKLLAMMRKFMDWSAKAREIDAETFRKSLGVLGSGKLVTNVEFSWSKDLKIGRLRPFDLYEDEIHATLSTCEEDLACLRKELLEKQQKLAAQDKFFK